MAGSDSKLADALNKKGTYENERSIVCHRREVLHVTTHPQLQCYCRWRRPSSAHWQSHPAAPSRRNASHSPTVAPTQEPVASSGRRFEYDSSRRSSKRCCLSDGLGNCTE